MDCLYKYNKLYFKSLYLHLSTLLIFFIFFINSKIIFSMKYKYKKQKPPKVHFDRLFTHNTLIFNII